MRYDLVGFQFEELTVSGIILDVVIEVRAQGTVRGKYNVLDRKKRCPKISAESELDPGRVESMEEE